MQGGDIGARIAGEDEFEASEGDGGDRLGGGQGQVHAPPRLQRTELE